MPNLTAAVPGAVLPRPGMAPSGDALEARAVHKTFGAVTALAGADLLVRPGKVVALLGPSGCGKSTLLRTLAGLERPDAGEVRLGERVLSGDGVFVAPEKRRLGMVFQDAALFPHLDVRANVAFGLSRQERASGRVEETLELVGLAGFGDRMPATLSGGQRQRVALARALATRPRVLLLDEPFSSLDASLRTRLRSEVQRLLRDLAVTALFVTHDQEEAFVVGDEVAVMFGGRVEQQSTPAELYAAPATRTVAEFVGDANLLRGTAHGDHAETLVGAVPLRTTLRGDVEVMVRPEQLRVTSGEAAVVDAVEYYGHDALYVLRDPHAGLLRARVLAAPVFRPGDRVDVDYVGAATVGYPL